MRYVLQLKAGRRYPYPLTEPYQTLVDRQAMRVGRSLLTLLVAKTFHTILLCCTVSFFERSVNMVIERWSGETWFSRSLARLACEVKKCRV